jgi:transposase
MNINKTYTVGIDLGDRKHEICVVDREAEIVETRKIESTREALKKLAKDYPRARVVIECGTQSPWISRYLSQVGMEVIVANARKVRAIWDQDFKSDSRDAEMLARLGRLDPKLLRPIQHGSEQGQKELLSMKMRDTLVRRRLDVINAIRGTLKSLGYRVSNPSSARFHKIVLEEVPAEQHPVIAPLVKVLETITEQVKGYDRMIAHAAQAHPSARHLQQIVGIGPLTALYFVHKIEDPERFARGRDIGPYLGLSPKRDQSGDLDKQLRITKAGDSYLRRLLVNASQYILGPFGKECALREFGLRLCERGGSRAKKKAVVAVARKLAVLMITLWKSREDFELRLAEAA